MNLIPVKGRTCYLDGDGYIGVYLLDGGRCILLDSGQRWEKEELLTALSGQGLTLAGILTSHIHTDHAINNGWLRERTGCRVAAPAGELHLIRGVGHLRGYLSCLSPGMLAARFGSMIFPVDDPIPPEDGMFEFCGAAFRVIHTPGHSEDHLCFVTPDRVCYAGDAVLGTENMAKLPYAFCLAQTLESAERLRGLDCDGWILAHRQVCRDIAPAADHTRALLLRRAAEICSLVTGPMTAGEIWQSAAAMYELHTKKPVNALLLERNFTQYLHFLTDRGALIPTAEGGVVRYAPADRKEDACEA